jgi:hypothetical protein
MEGVELEVNNESKNAAPGPKQPIVVAEFVETPTWRSGRDRKSGASKPLEERPSNSADLSNSNQLNSKNPILSEEEAEHLKRADVPAIVGLIQLGVVATIIGGYFAWKWGWLSWPTANLPK